MKKLIFSLVVISAILVAQENVTQDSTAVQDTLKTNEDYKVDRDKDTWMETWKEIEPNIKDFLEEEDEEIEWDEEGNVKKRRKKKGYFRAVGGGWDIVRMPVSVSLIDNKLKSMQLNEFKSEMDLYGGGGWVFLGDHLRIGGMAADGRLNSSETINGITRKVQMDLDFGGFLAEYVWHPFSKTEISIGSVFGGSDLSLKVIEKTGSDDWDNVWNDFNDDIDVPDAYNRKTTFKNKFFSAQPQIGFRYNIFRIFAVGAKVGYFYGITNDDAWEVNGYDLDGVPEMDFSNYFYSINFYFGA